MQYRNNKTRPATIFRAWEDSPTIRIILAQRQKLVLGLTLLEMVIAMAIMAIIFAAILPQFRIIQNSWDSQAGAAETLQNGRVLIDHLNRNLSKAVRITAVSSSSETNGYIEFIGNNANNVRYDVNSTSDYVEFGLLGNLSDLAGPVSKLQFTCYDAFDLSTPITDVNSIRSVKVETTLTNFAKLDQDMTFSTQAYIRTNALPAAGWNILKLSEPWLEFETQSCKTPALCQINNTHYLCVYEGPGSPSGGGWAVVLIVNLGDWTITKATPFEFGSYGVSPALAKIDTAHYICAYEGAQSDGYAVVLTVDTGNWSISKATPFEFDTTNALTPALAKIDDTHYLCVYEGFQEDATAVILTVNPITWEVTKGTPLDFDGTGETPALCQIDATHYLCAYQGLGFHGKAVVLTVDTVAGTVTQGPDLSYASSGGNSPALCKIDSTNYLCAYSNQSAIGYCIILTADPVTWEVSNPGAPFEFDLNGQTPALARIESTHYLCAYSGEGDDGWGDILTVNTGDWSISKGTSFEFDTIQGIAPAICQVDSTHYLCAYDGNISIGTAGVFQVEPIILP